MFVSNNRALFHLRWKKDLVKHQKFSKYYENDCLQNFLSLFMFLSTAKVLKNSHILGRICFIFLKAILKQTRNFLNTKFQPHWNDRKSSYQVRQVLGLFFHLTALISGSNNVKSPRVTKIVKKNLVWKGVWQVRIKTKFSETISHKIFETSSIFDIK